MNLFVGRDRRNPARHDVGSVLCMNLADGVRVVESSRSMRDRPAWLRGTPTLFVDGRALEGHEALDFLQQRALAAAEERGRAAPREEEPRRPRRAPTAPTVQLKPEKEPGPVEEAPQDSVSDELWDTRVDDAPDETYSNAKLSSDDLARAIQQRQG